MKEFSFTNKHSLLKLSGRLEIGHSACSEKTPVLIVHIERIKMGIAIDQVTGILRIQESEIEKLPQNIIEERAKHLKRNCTRSTRQRKCIYDSFTGSLILRK